MQHSFNEEDKQKLVDFLNMVASHAKFELTTQELIKYFGLLSYMQKTFIPKVDAHIFEIKRIIKQSDSEKPEKAE